MPHPCCRRDPQILSLGRNAIKKIEGLNEVCDTLEQLWISYNQIGSFSGIEKLVNLTVFYASNNKIDKWAEVCARTACDTAAARATGAGRWAAGSGPLWGGDLEER